MNISKGILRLVAFLIGIIMGFAIVGWLKNRELLKEQQKLKHEISVLVKSDFLIRDTIRDTVEVVTQRVNTVEKIKEVLSKEDKALIKDLGIKMSELQAFQKMGTASGDTVFLTGVKPDADATGSVGGETVVTQQHTQPTDSLPSGQGTDADSVLRYKDAWMEFTYWPKTGKLAWESKDTFDIAVKREFKHKLLFLKWGTKGYWTKLVSHNQRTKVTYNSFVMKK